MILVPGYKGKDLHTCLNIYWSCISVFVFEIHWRVVRYGSWFKKIGKGVLVLLLVLLLLLLLLDF